MYLVLPTPYSLFQRKTFKETIMSFFKRMLSSVGIGAAKVDTVLFKNQFTQGETIEGVVTIQGGDVEQKIDDIYVSIETHYKGEDTTEVGTLSKHQLAQSFVIAANEKREFPFSMQLPFHTPVTMGNTKVWLQTGLDIKSAIDPSDQDHIQVFPSELLNALFVAIEQLGFTTRQIETQKAPYHLQHITYIAQQFEYVPYSGPFQGKLDEFEIVPIVQANQVTVFMEIDRRARNLGGLFAEMLDTDETRVQLTVGPNDLPNLRNMLYEQISRYS